MHFLRIGIAIAVAALLTDAAVVLENGLPVDWEKAPADLSKFPLSSGVVTINPWDFSQRMGMYRLLMNSTADYMSFLWANASDSPLWGLPMQLGWKLKSGRLADPTGATTCGKHSGDPMCISPQSYWACVNYYVSVIPFLAAVHTGVIGDGVTQIQVQAPADGAQDYCISYTDCSQKYPDMMSKWETFFKTLKIVSSSKGTDLEKKDRVLGSMWDAQQASLQQATSSCQQRQNPYSSKEVSFSDSWISASDYVAAAHFQSSIEKSEKFMRPLPSRILKEGDEAPNIADLSTEENHTVYIFSWMSSANKLLGGTLVRLWRSAMCSEVAREKGRTLLEDLLLNPKFAVSGLLSVLTEMATNC
ncbi:liver-enriched gene 1, tandem duplicate 1 [Denticeps clupeoides]|uniref:liver-enriched gene 1, tandem duplicate 1 n=1 Tax=Denticeps clupeoides TaxID=299321 RepID=UPI0010A2CCE8|nr:protein LEG1 homolog [Denticeps clupeoides]